MLLVLAIILVTAWIHFPTGESVPIVLRIALIALQWLDEKTNISRIPSHFQPESHSKQKQKQKLKKYEMNGR